MKSETSGRERLINRERLFFVRLFFLNFYLGFGITGHLAHDVDRLALDDGHGARPLHETRRRSR